MREKKEDNERISFYLLLAPGMYHGGRNLSPGRRHVWFAAVTCMEGALVQIVYTVQQILCLPPSPAAHRTTADLLVDLPGSTRTGRRRRVNCSSRRGVLQKILARRRMTTARALTIRYKFLSLRFLISPSISGSKFWTCRIPLQIAESHID